MSTKVHRIGLSPGVILHQDSDAKIQVRRYLSKYQEQGLVLAKEQGGPSFMSTINHMARVKHTVIQHAQPHAYYSRDQGRCGQ